MDDSSQAANGGAAGFIRYPELAALLIAGYAVAGTDTGHDGSAADWSFARGHPEKVADLGYRAVHEMTLKAKAVIKAFYEKPPARAYWSGCSTGGRQGLTEAQLFPGDFDGIAAGAPANYMTRIEAQFLWVAQALHETPDSFIPPTKITALHRAVLQACDAKDGVKDGIIDDPQSCSFNPRVVACSGSDRAMCLSEAQIKAARSVYSPSRNPRTNEVLYPGLVPGSELGWSREPVGEVLEQPSPLAIGFLKNVVFANPNWDYRTFDFDKDMSLMDERGKVLNAIDPNLSPFFALGGKLLQYHGWADGQLSPLNSINYYTSVAARLGGTDQISNSYRLFMVPGMDHCRGGEGTDRFDMLS